MMLGIILYVNYLGTKRLLKLILSVICSLYFGVKFNLFLNLKNCPECYGTDLCPYFQAKQFEFGWMGYILLLFNPKLTKSVFYGTLNGSEWVVFKRKYKRNDKLPVTDLESVRQTYLLDENKEVQNVVLCPGFGGLQPLFQGLGKSIDEEHLWLELSSSIEPLLLKYFQKNGQFPVPRYLGACGDLIAEEYKGLPLTNFLSSSFQTRVQLAVELLKMAHSFTFDSPEYVFYFTDVSEYNLVVDSNGTVSLVDMDNIIILDRKVHQENVRNVHRSELLEEYEYAHLPFDICNRYLSDHNYFTICVHLLTHPESGLLREIPSNVTAAHPNLKNLLNECREPKSFGNRIPVGEKLRSLLQSI